MNPKVAPGDYIYDLGDRETQWRRAEGDEKPPPLVKVVSVHCWGLIVEKDGVESRCEYWDRV